MLAVAACGDDDAETEGTEESSSSEESDETTTTTLSEEEEVLAAYEAAMDAVAAAYEAADPEHPDLVATFDGESLFLHQGTLGEYQRDGLSEKQEESEYNPSVESLTGDTAVVEDCYREVLQVVDAETGEQRGEPTEDTAHVRRTMELIDGTWKIVQGENLGESC